MCKLFSILIKQLKLYLILKIKLIVNSPNFLLYLTIGVLVDLMLGSLVVESPEFQESWQHFKVHYPQILYSYYLYLSEFVLLKILILTIYGYLFILDFSSIVLYPFTAIIDVFLCVDRPIFSLDGQDLDFFWSFNEVRSNLSLTEELVKIKSANVDSDFIAESVRHKKRFLFSPHAHDEDVLRALKVEATEKTNLGTKRLHQVQNHLGLEPSGISTPLILICFGIFCHSVYVALKTQGYI